MIYYKVRRKSDGAYYPFERSTKRKQDEFYQQWSSATNLYNGAGWSGDIKPFLERFRSSSFHLSYYGSEEKYKAHMLSRPTYADLELVKFDDNGRGNISRQVVVWSGSKCVLTKKEADKFEPVDVGDPLTQNQKDAGIRDEIGPLLDKIEEAEQMLNGERKKKCDIDSLFADIDVKQHKLAAALEELQARSTKLKEMIKSIYIT